MKYILLALMFCLVACDQIDTRTSDQISNHQQENLAKQAVQAVGLPSIVNFQEKRNFKMILELRDSEKLPTHTYILDLNGNLHKLCDSVGYGIPGGTQYTNPSRPALSTETHEAGNIVLPQADPNGLFSPASAEGTWVMCLNTETKGISPVYVEPRIIVSPFALK